MTDRLGPWFPTIQGKCFYPLDPRPEDMVIEDIACALAFQPRFYGRVRHFYSVAEHCVRVSLQVPEPFALYGLLHDAPEAFLGDMNGPLKAGSPLGQAYRHVEANVWDVLCDAYKIFDGIGDEATALAGHAAIHNADLQLLATEVRDVKLLPPFEKCEPAIQEWLEIMGKLALPVKIVPWTPERAKVQFLHRFDYLWLARPLYVEATKELTTAQQVETALFLMTHDDMRPLEVIEAWTQAEREAVFAWAMAAHANAGDHHDVVVPRRPAILNNTSPLPRGRKAAWE